MARLSLPGLLLRRRRVPDRSGRRADDRSLPRRRAERQHDGRRAAARNPSTFTVSVVDGTGITNQAHVIAAGLRRRGFVIHGVGTATPFGVREETVVYHANNSVASLAAAQAVIHTIEGPAVMALGRTTAGATVTVLTGSDASVLPPPHKATTTTTTLKKKHHGTERLRRRSPRRRSPWSTHRPSNATPNSRRPPTSSRHCSRGTHARVVRTEPRAPEPRRDRCRRGTDVVCTTFPILKRVFLGFLVAVAMVVAVTVTETSDTAQWPLRRSRTRSP